MRKHVTEQVGLVAHMGGKTPCTNHIISVSMYDPPPPRLPT